MLRHEHMPLYAGVYCKRTNISTFSTETFSRGGGQNSTFEYLIIVSDIISPCGNILLAKMAVCVDF